MTSLLGVAARMSPQLINPWDSNSNVVACNVSNTILETWGRKRERRQNTTQGFFYCLATCCIIS